jgi:hypothetical protein
LSAVLEKEGRRRKEGGREGGMRKEDCQFIQRKSSEVKQKGVFLLTSKNKD